MSVNRRQFGKISLVGSVIGLSGCSSSPNPGSLTKYADSGFGFSPNDKLAEGDSDYRTFGASYTCSLKYSVRDIKQSNEGYSDAGKVDILVTRRNPSDDLTGSLSKPIDTVSVYGVEEYTEVVGTIQPGRYRVFAKNTGGRDVRFTCSGDMTRVPYDQDSCSEPISSQIDITHMKFFGDSGTYYLIFHFKIRNPQSNNYEWSIKALSKSQEESITTEIGAECAAHFCGTWEIDENDILQEGINSDRIKIEIKAMGEKDEYQTYEWIEL